MGRGRDHGKGSTPRVQQGLGSWAWLRLAHCRWVAALTAPCLGMPQLPLRLQGLLPCQVSCTRQLPHSVFSPSTRLVLQDEYNPHADE